jgi:thiol:disulfide interchange protein
MMRWFFCMAFLISLQAAANDSSKLYNPKANAVQEVARLLAKARKENKQVLLQIGGNWCVACYRLNSFVQRDSTLKRLVDNNYVLYHLNYSPENKNPDLLKKLGFPQRFGFPVLVVLDADGNRLHTQDTGLLEKGNGYDKEKIRSFLVQWSTSALNEIFYKE